MSIHHIFYHRSDHDGHCSGAIAYHALGEDPNNVKLYSINYGDDFPFDAINKDDYVYMLDFSLPPEKLIKVHKCCKKFTWIDHHKNIIDVTNKDETFKEIDGIRSVAHSGAYYTFKYFYPTLEIPIFIEYISKYDTWKNSDKREWNDVILPFHYGLLASDTLISDSEGNCRKDQTDHLIKLIFKDKHKIRSIIDNGKTILGYIKQSNIVTLKAHGYKSLFEGLNTYVCNCGGNSSVFDDTDQNGIDALVMFSFNGEEFSFSIYKSETNNKVDVSEIARKYGGGGHPGAAGFTNKKIILEKCGEILFKNDKH